MAKLVAITYTVLYIELAALARSITVHISKVHTCTVKPYSAVYCIHRNSHLACIVGHRWLHNYITACTLFVARGEKCSSLTREQSPVVVTSMRTETDVKLAEEPVTVLREPRVKRGRVGRGGSLCKAIGKYHLWPMRCDDLCATNQHIHLNAVHRGKDVIDSWQLELSHEAVNRDTCDGTVLCLTCGDTPAAGLAGPVREHRVAHSGSVLLIVAALRVHVELLASDRVGSAKDEPNIAQAVASDHILDHVVVDERCLDRNHKSPMADELRRAHRKVAIVRADVKDHVTWPDACRAQPALLLRPILGDLTGGGRPSGGEECVLEGARAEERSGRIGGALESRAVGDASSSIHHDCDFHTMLQDGSSHSEAS